MGGEQKDVETVRLRRRPETVTVHELVDYLHRCGGYEQLMFDIENQLRAFLNKE